MVVVSDFQLTGDVYTDGAMSGGARKGTERSGWAALLIDHEGKVVGGIYGTCPDWFPTSLRAELWAALQALRHGCPPITLWIDNDSVVKGFHRGREWCCDSSRPAADLWRKFWWKFDDLGGEGITINKVKGHATDADIDSGRTSKLAKDGNDHADHFAGRGSSLAEELSSTAGDRRSFLQAKRWYSWLATLVANWPADTQRKISMRSVPQET